MNPEEARAIYERDGYDPLFVNAVLNWLDDLALADAQLSYEQLDAAVEAQKEFALPGDRLLRRMRCIRAEFRRLLKAKRPHVQLLRKRMRRAFRDCGFSSNGTFIPNSICKSGGASHETPAQGVRHCPAAQGRDLTDRKVKAE